MIEKNYFAGLSKKDAEIHGWDRLSRNFQIKLNYEGQRVSGMIASKFRQSVDDILEGEGYIPPNRTTNKGEHLHEGTAPEYGVISIRYKEQGEYRTSVRMVFLQTDPDRVEELDSLIKNSLEEITEKAIQSGKTQEPRSIPRIIVF